MQLGCWVGIASLISSSGVSKDARRQDGLVVENRVVIPSYLGTFLAG